MRKPKKIESLKARTDSYNPIDAPSNPSNFLRLFPESAFYALSLFANQQTKILLYLLYNMDGNNSICCTYDEIAIGCDISTRKVIAKTMKELHETHVITTIHQSYYMINPAILLKGDNSHFHKLFNDYQDYVNHDSTQTQEDK